jgi:hypothetical protein
LFFRIEKNHPGIVWVFWLDYVSRDQIYHFIHLTLRLFSTPQWERARDRLPGVHSEHIRKHCRWKPLLKYIILYENKMAGKGEKTRARKR